MDLSELINECRNDSIKPPGEKGRPTNESQGRENHFIYRNRLLKEKNADNFPDEIIEHVSGEVITEEDDTALKLELYRETAFAVRDKYIADNPERVKKNITNWNIDLYTQIKKSIPKPDYKNLDLLDGLYSIYEEVCASVGAVASLYGFAFFCGIPVQTLEQWRNERYLTPEHSKLAKKWDKNTTGQLFDRLYNGTGNTIGTIFALKQRGYIESNGISQNENARNLKNIDDIPTFGIEDKSENE